MSLSQTPPTPQIYAHMGKYFENARCGFLHWCNSWINKNKFNKQSKPEQSTPWRLLEMGEGLKYLTISSGGTNSW